METCREDVEPLAVADVVSVALKVLGWLSLVAGVVCVFAVPELRSGEAFAGADGSRYAVSDWDVWFRVASAVSGLVGLGFWWTLGELLRLAKRAAGDK